MKNLNGRGAILILGLVGILGSCSVLYPSKACRAGLVKSTGEISYECRVAGSWGDEWKGYYLRLTEIGNDCIIDINNKGGYRVMIDSGCDGTVNSLIDDNRVRDRGDFGDSYDWEFSSLKGEVGHYDPNHDVWHKAKEI